MRHSGIGVRGLTVTVFKLWAPAAAHVDLDLDGRLLPTCRGEGGWHTLETDAGPNTYYRFRTGDVSVPDPAARAQHGDWSVVTDPTAYPWQDRTWRGRPWEETIFYELHAGLLGGFAGIETHLPRLADLGITAVELMPIAHTFSTRNWGYDGVLPYAPSDAYGTPDALKHMVDRAHALGLMVFLDVVYNHFGPSGNYLPHYAPAFFREDRHTPWGAGIDFRRPEVRRFFIDNAVMWVRHFHIDGLRLDAIHAIDDDGYIVELAQAARAAAPHRHVHIVVENERNDGELLSRGRIAQWNDDFHHALHVMLTGETAGYYGAYADAPAQGLARSLNGHFIQERSGPSPQLLPTAFVNFLQNHDHVGNRAFGERLIALADPQALTAAVALLMLAPSIPLLFFGEEVGAREPFLYFCDHRNPKLADAVREGRSAEFAKFPEFADPKRRNAIPDPNAPETFARSRPRLEGGEDWHTLYKELIALRRTHIIPRLKGAIAEHSEAIGPKAVRATWRMGDNATLTLFCNLGDDPVAIPAARGEMIWDRAGTRCWITLP
ncbi:MAG: malto-oligosyltrehalose trehalohydrolase [Alphaproteobacteria bacterium]|nr:malto-oligosyltrehalose trehalohydrolase [Alphaproteobacteria bacterium]